MSAKKVVSGLSMHCHHGSKLFGFCYDYDERVEYIKENKPEAEQKLRLRLFKIPPRDRIPGLNSPEWEACDKAREAYNKAWEACNKAREAYNKAREACDKAWEAYNKAWEAYITKYEAELEMLHDEFCPDCPWDGETIFTRKDKDGIWY